MNCPNCGGTVPPGTNRCRKCGSTVEQPAAAQTPQPTAPADQSVPGRPDPRATSDKTRLVAGLLGIFLGWLGIHRFYLGYYPIGGVMLALGIVGFFTCGVTSAISGIWGLVEGILILTKSFDADSDGRKLKD